MNELRILTSEKDKYSLDMYELGDYFGNYISNIKSAMEIGSDLVNVSPATLGIINDVINVGFALNADSHYILNFDGLPEEIKQGLGKRYVLGQSRQVEGDLRAVLIDKETQQRVKDITLKKVTNTQYLGNLTGNLLLQMQLKQISDKLDSIYDLVRFQLKRSRDRDFVEPFFNARDRILEAQVTISEEERKKSLEKAVDFLKGIQHAGYQEFLTSSEELYKVTRNPLLANNSKAREFMAYMSEDIYVINKSVGLQMQIYDYLGKQEEIKELWTGYINSMSDFSNNVIGKKGETPLGLLQNNYPYVSSNINVWSTFMRKITLLKQSYDSLEVKTNTLLVCAEG